MIQPVESAEGIDAGLNRARRALAAGGIAGDGSRVFAQGLLRPLRALGIAAHDHDLRARREASFGARLLSDLTARLDNDGTPWQLTWTDKKVRISHSRLPVLWEAPDAMRECARLRHAAILLNDRPQPGLEATLLDSISIDDFSGGASAAQLLLSKNPRAKKLAILAGPEGDARAQQRRDGFLSVAPRAATVASQSWFFEDGYAVAKNVVNLGQDGVFCCNDRLAEAVSQWCRDENVAAPPLVGFDDAPVAERLDLTTIALPWDEMISAALEVVKRRLVGTGGAARQLILTPCPVLRRL
jgi:hypothetical protein